MPQKTVFGSLAAVSLLLFGCSTPERVQSEPEPSYSRAFLLLWEDKADQAADMDEAILADMPLPQTYDEVTEYGDTLLLLCEAQTALKDYTAAEESCLKAIDNFEAERGNYQRRAPLKAYDQLFAVYEKAGIRQDRISAELAVRDRYLKGLPVQAMLIVPRINMLTRIGDLHRSSGDWQGSEAAYREAIGFTDQLPQFHYSDADRKPCLHLSCLYRASIAPVETLTPPRKHCRSALRSRKSLRSSSRDAAPYPSIRSRFGSNSGSACSAAGRRSPRISISKRPPAAARSAGR